MFSGLTNQVSSWMGSVKGETEEKVPTPTEDTNNLLQDEPLKLPETSPTKATEGSKLEMFSNVKNQIEGIGGWIGSSIPKLRKGHNEGNPGATGVENPAADVNSPTGLAPGAVSGPRDDDDNSRNYSATGGADSGPGTANDSPTEENKDQLGNVQSKALAGAKTLGNFLYSAVNKAGKTVSEASAKIKETVEKNNILGEFNKEQDAFLKEKANGTFANLPPWAGCPNEESLKEECLSLSTDKRNFVRAPPAGVDFVFDYEMKYPVAMAIMEQDPNLEKMRYELVPKIISEEEFWRNYFYRVSLICQANEVSSSQGIVTDTIEPVDKTEMVHEFISDSLQVSQEDLKEVEEGMKKLGVIDPKALSEEEWEKELEAELNDYELVTDAKSASTASKTNWEDEADYLLREDTDLKMTSTNVVVGFGETKQNSSKVLRPPGGGHSDIFGVRDNENNGIITPSKRKNVSASTISSCFSMVDDEPKPVRNGSTPTTPEKANILNGNGEITPQKNGNIENGHQNGFSDENKSPLKQNGELNGKSVTDSVNGMNGTNGTTIPTPSRLKNKVPPGGYSSGLW